MLTKKEIKELASHMLKDSLYVSLYLDVDPKNNPKDKWLLHFKNLAKEATGKLNSKDKASIKPDIERIERFLADRPDGLQRGLAIFSSQAANFWRYYHTAFPFSNQMVIENDPYIKPLAAMNDIYQRYLIIVVRGERGRVLISDMGEIEELPIVINPRPDTDPGRDGKTGDMGEVRARKQKEEAQKKLHKEIKNVIDKVRREEGIDRILLGGTENARGRFREYLPDNMTRRIVGEFSVEYNAHPKEILDVCLPLKKKIEYKFERKALKELFNQGANGSVYGLSDVLNALQQGNVRKMYVMSNISISGMVCNVCGALTEEHNIPCPYCGGEMRRVNYMLDHAIQKAIDQGARIDMLDEAPELVKAGGIGALLRY